MAPATSVAPDTHTIDAAGVSTSVRRQGQGRTVLFLHGAFFPTMWTPFHEAMSDHVDLVAPIHPGYVDGGPPDWLRGFDDLVLHYRSLVDVLDLGRVDLVGYDLGGWIGAQFAVFYPERVRSFTAVAPLGLWMPDAPAFEFLARSPSRVAEVVFNGKTDGLEHLFPDETDIDAFVQTYGENGVTARLIWERHYDTGLERRLAGLTMPSLVVTPRQDGIVPSAHAKRWAEVLPHSRLVQLDDVGHGVVLQDGERLALEILRFLSEVPS